MKKSLLFGIILTACIVIVAFVFAQFYPEGMISYWKFDEGSGLTASDSVDGNHGTLVNGPGWITGLVDDALSFDGVDDYVDVGNDASLTSLTPSAMTIEAWVYNTQMISVTGIDLRTIVAQRPNGQTKGYCLQYGYVAGYGIDDYCVTIAFFGGYQGIVKQDISPNQWHHIAGVFDNNMATIYINGEAQTTTNIGSGYTTSNDDVIIGRHGNWASRYDYHKGIIDEVAIYNRALSADEINQHYENCSYDMECVPSGMVSWWDGDAISGTTALDIQDGNDGTMDGGVSTILGKVGNAFSFDGVDDFVEVPDSDSLDTGTQFTVDAWFNTDNVDKIDPGTGSQTQTIVMYGFDPADGKNNPLHIREGKLYLAIRGYGSGFYDLMGVTSVNSNTWYHAAVTYDGTTAKLYLNGALEDSKLSSMNMNTNSRVTIGRYQNPLNLKLYFYFDGLIDEIEIFNRALPQSEIQAIYNAGSAGKCKGEVVIEVDIKPGSYPNCFNSNGHGVIPVAILGSEDFDVSTIDPSTVMLDSQAVRVKGKSGNWGSLEDVNGDGFDDLVVQILDDGVYTQGSTIGIITATSYDGATSFKGEDSICITQD